MNVNLFPFRLLLPFYAGSVSLLFIYRGYDIFLPHSVLYLLGFAIVGVLTSISVFPAGYVLRGAVIFSACFTVFFGIILTLTTRKWVYYGWMTVCSLGLVSFVVAAFEYTTGWHASLSQVHQLPNRPPYDSYVTAWFTNVNDMSFFLVLSLIPALVLGFTARKTTTRLFWLAMWITGFSLTIHLGARASILGFAVAGFVVVGFVYSDRLRYVAGRFPTRFGQAAAPLIGIFAVLIFALVPNPASTASSSLWIRWQLQKAAAYSGGLTGNGLGSSYTVIGRSPIRTNGVGSPHSWYGALLTDTGIIGLTIFLAFYGGLVSRLCRSAALRQPVHLMGATAVITLPIAGLGPSNAFLMPLFWIVLGLAVSALQIQAEH